MTVGAERLLMPEIKFVVQHLSPAPQPMTATPRVAR